MKQTTKEETVLEFVALIGDAAGLSEERLDELKKATLKSYVKKAEKSSERHLRKADDHEDKAMATDGMKHPDRQKKHETTAIHHFRKFQKREGGIAQVKHNLITKKVTKEDVDTIVDIMTEGQDLTEAELNELKKSTLSSFVAKTQKRSDNHNKAGERHVDATDDAADMGNHSKVKHHSGRAASHFQKADRYDQSAEKGRAHIAKGRFTKEESELTQEQSDEIRAKVQADLAAHRAKKDAVLAAAKAELDAHTKEKKKAAGSIYARIKDKEKAKAS